MPGLLKRFSDLLISSPCTARCNFDSKLGYCSGCYRTLDEITHWPALNGEQKHEVNRRALVRREQANQA